MNNRVLKWALLLILGLAISYLVLAGYKLIKWNAYWFPTYLQQQLLSTSSSADIEHVMFIVADHYEPGFDQDEAVQALSLIHI